MTYPFSSTLVKTLFISTLALGLLPLSGEAFARSKKSHLIENAFEEVTVRPPLDEEVCFSPDEPCDIKLNKFVEMAQTSIDVAIYDINLDGLVHLLLEKSKKMPVRILVDRKQAKGSHSAVPLLIKAGANVRYGRQRGIMHNKFIIVDGKAIETGSFNHTNHAARANNENQIYLTKASIVERYRKRFEHIWAQGDRTVRD